LREGLSACAIFIYGFIFMPTPTLSHINRISQAAFTLCMNILPQGCKELVGFCGILCMMGWTTRLDRWSGPVDWTTALGRRAGPLDCTTGPGHWTGPMHWTTGLFHWTVPLHWATGLYHWTGQVDLATGLGHWTGPPDWATGAPRCRYDDLHEGWSVLGV